MPDLTPRPCNRCAAPVIDWPLLEGGTVPLGATPVEAYVCGKEFAQQILCARLHHRLTCKGKPTEAKEPSQ